MRRHIPGLHSVSRMARAILMDCSWSVSNEPPTGGIRRSLSASCDSSFWNPKSFASRSFSGRLYCTERALWKLNWFLRDFGYDTELLSHDQVDEKSLQPSRHRTYHAYNAERTFLPESRRLRACCRVGRTLLAHQSSAERRRETLMIYSYTQISNYLRCPRSYRYRYLDGWREKETRAAMAFGRCFENALGAYFRGEDCGAALFKEWGAFRDLRLNTRKERPGTGWCTRESICLRGSCRTIVFVSIVPKTNLQIKILQTLPGRQRVCLLSRCHR